MEYLQDIIRQLSDYFPTVVGKNRGYPQETHKTPFGNSQVYQQGVFPTTFGNLYKKDEISFKGFKYLKDLKL